MYVHTEKDDHAENKATMQMEWQLEDNFSKLARTINGTILYVQFANAPIPEKDAVDSKMKMLMSTGVFERQYQEWHARQDNQKRLDKLQGMMA